MTTETGLHRITVVSARALHTIFAVNTFRISMRVIVFFTLLLGFAFTSKAIVDPPKLLRACLNGSDSMVTILWEPPSDACGSFSEYHIYGRENNGPVMFLYTEKNLSTSSVQFKLPSADFKWNFYIETLHTCNGVDSLKSNVVYVDKDAPAFQQLDSVSVDRTSQKLIIGWQKNDSNDVKWYRVYEKTTNSNRRIADTAGLYYVFKQHSVLSPIQIRHAAFDSCDNPAGISDPHSHMILSQSVDTCAVSVTLNWSSYVGWNQVDNYSVFYSVNGGQFTLDASTSNTNHVFTNFKLGDQLCFFVRATKTGPTRVTSSSNEMCLSTRAPIPPSVDYVETVTVDGKLIDIRWASSGSGDIKTTELMKDDGAGEVPVYSKPGSSLSDSYSDPDVSVDQQSYIYVVQTRDQCDKVLSRSNTSHSILLSLSRPSLSWNPYVGWAGTVKEYVIESYDGSTWNILATTNATSYDLDSSFFTNSVCLRVRAIETGNPNNNQEALSNQVCTDGDFVFYIPNAMNPNNEENYFKVVGTNIDYDQSTGLIFNRWGEKIVALDNLETGWNGTINGEPLPLGIYYYSVRVYSLNGKSKEQNGYIRIIR